MKKGFTFLELLIASVIIAIVATGTFSIVYNKIQGMNMVKVMDSNRQQILVQLDNYYKKNRTLPADFKSFLLDTSYFPQTPVNPFYQGKPEDGWIYIYDADTYTVIVLPRT
ncbi:MAG: type II secretion system protein [Conexivisphaerales archaeon]